MARSCFKFTQTDNYNIIYVENCSCCFYDLKIIEFTVFQKKKELGKFCMIFFKGFAAVLMSHCMCL